MPTLSVVYSSHFHLNSTATMRGVFFFASTCLRMGFSLVNLSYAKQTGTRARAYSSSSKGLVDIFISVGMQPVVKLSRSRAHQATFGSLILAAHLFPFSPKQGQGDPRLLGRDALGLLEGCRPFVFS